VGRSWSNLAVSSTTSYNDSFLSHLYSFPSCLYPTNRPTYELAEPYGLTLVGGGCPSVGVSGFMLGAGFSFLSRSYGLGIDNLLTMSLMLPNGSIVELNDEESKRSNFHRQLWWAVRGGGGGNFGVTLSFAMKMYPSPKILVGQVCWDYDSLFDLLVGTLIHSCRLFSHVPLISLNFVLSVCNRHSIIHGYQRYLMH
jgi:FAD/FMN-containing dehydrogenase